MTNITKRVNTESVFVYLSKAEAGKPVPVSDWEYVNSDGYKVKSIQAAIKQMAEISSLALALTPSSTATELFNTTVP